MQAPDYTLRQLSYFLTAIDEGTISAASARLHVTPSAVSDAITALERALGERLCVRRRAHGIRLTSAGGRVASRAHRLLSDAGDLALSLHSAEGDLVGPITLGCHPILAPTILPRLLDEFGTAHPRVELDVVEATHDQLEGRLESGEVDVAFVYDTLVPGNPRRQELFSLPAHVLLAADDALASQEVITLEQVVDRDLILLDAPPSSQHTLSLFARRGLTPHIRLRTASYEAVRTLVGRGLGYGILVQRPANPKTYEGYPVVMKEIRPAVPPVGIEVIWSAAAPPTDRARRLIDFAASIRWPGSAG